jgi:murein DD-endopeptidase MepM/ murein hydrolase activator NlpD
MANLFWPFDLSTVTEWPGTVRAGGVVHMGTDFGIPQGTPLRATITGRIVRINNDGLGAYVLDIIRADGLCVRNAHLSRMDVNTGDQVTAGQVIGLTGGGRGTAGAGYSTGPHLHWELRWDRLWQNGSWVDPRTVTVDSFTTLAELDAPTPIPLPKGKDMIILVQTSNDGFGYVWNLNTSFIAGIGSIAHFEGLKQFLPLFTLDSKADLEVYLLTFRDVFASAPVDSSTIAASVASAVGNVNVNVDAVASAIAKKLGAPVSEPITKADVQAAIEANYKESK